MRGVQWSRAAAGIWVGVLLCGVKLMAQATNTFPTSGNVGIGTTAPNQTLTVSGNVGVVNIDAQREFTYAAVGDVNTDLYFESQSSFANYGAHAGIYLARQNYQGAGSGNDLSDSVGLHINGFYSNSAAQLPIYLGGFSWNSEVPAVTINQAGSVGIGTTSPGAPLEVNGNVKLTYGSGSSITFADGTTQSTAYSGTCTATGGDYAESVDVSGEKSGYEPGDVIVLDPKNPRHFLLSSTPYSKLVAGIYSTKPGYVGRRQKGDPKLAAEIPMAMVGVVPTKVTAENGSIEIGDLLVTSSVSGYAMKGTDGSKITGAVVGKAMETLDKGTGVIEVLVSLQ